MVFQCWWHGTCTIPWSWPHFCPSIYPHFQHQTPDQSIFTAPTHSELHDFMQAYLSQHFFRWPGLPNFDEPLVTHSPPPCPHVQELGGQLPKWLLTSPWVNPLTNEVTTLIRVLQPTMVTAPSTSLSNPPQLGWVEFFAHCQEHNKKREKEENSKENECRLVLEKEAEKANQVHSCSPSKKSTVFEWVCKSSGWITLDPFKMCLVGLMTLHIDGSDKR